MKMRSSIVMGVVLSMVSGLQADYERPGPGPNLDSLSRSDGERAWDFWVRGYVGYNDNVQFLPGDAYTGFVGDRESAYLGFTAAGVYRFMEQGDVNAGVALRLDKLIYLEGLDGASGPGWTNEANNFDLTVVEPALYLNFGNGDTYYGRASYRFRWEETQGSAIGGEAHNLGIMLGTEISPCMSIEFDYEHGWDDFDITRANPADERDGERDRMSVSLIRHGSANAPRMVLGYSYLDKDSDGSNFSYDGHELLFRIEGQVAEKVTAAVQFSYADLDDDTSDPTFVRSKHDVLTAGVQLVYALDENWSADFYYRYLEVDADVPSFDGERSDVGFGLRYDF